MARSLRTAQSEHGARLPAALDGLTEPATGPERGYTARELVLCTFPHSDPGAVASWSRRNGNLTLRLQPGIDPFSGEALGYPYGSIPRLLLFWIITEAVRTQTREIQLTQSLSEFLREVGLNPNTGRGKRGDATRLRKQLMRLLRCHISFVYQEGTEEQGRGAWLDMQIAPKAVCWWDFKNPEQGSLFESFLVLGEDFYKAVTQTPVPIDLRALRGLKRSPFALDLYAWATYRVYTLGKSKDALAAIPLTQIQQQFGSEYSRLDNFKGALGKALAEVKEVFPELDYELRARDLVIRPGKVPIAERPKEDLYGSLRRRPGDLSDATRIWFYEHYAKFDLAAVLKDFNQWLEASPHIEPKNRNALFKKFAATWAERNA